MADFLSHAGYNPDVLSCLANLSNDEIFTSPDIANQMLDMLPEELFRNPDTTFLDPACKSGVFLREIAKRLLKGLEPQIPDLQKRIDHIFHKQLFGIAITEMTSLLSRRSVYCSKYPNSEFSVTLFDSPEGNVRFRRVEHTWGKITKGADGKLKASCIYCGANKEQYDRGLELETHAYEWIHTETPEELFNMKFDVIIGNPPYQLSDGGGKGSSAIPIYHKFVEQAKKLNPRYLTMVIPARWFTGGRGLDEFRKEMLHDDRIREIHDFPNSNDCFREVKIEGGVCYFLWDRDSRGLCKVSTHIGQNPIVSEIRPLLEDDAETFIRSSAQISILKKVRVLSEDSFMELVSANDPFGYDVRVKGSYRRIKPQFTKTYVEGFSKFYYYGWNKEGVGYIDKQTAKKGSKYFDKWKIYITKAYGMGQGFPTQVINAPFIGEPDSLCTETYLIIGPFDSELEANNACSYIYTKFFRFMVMFKKNTQNDMQGVYQFVPMQDFSKPWTDEELYAKYNLTEDEIAFIESMISPMDLEGGDIDVE